MNSDTFPFITDQFNLSGEDQGFASGSVVGELIDGRVVAVVGGHGIKIFQSDGTALTPFFEVTERNDIFVTTPSVAGLADGGFVVVWKTSIEYEEDGFTGYQSDLRMRVFNEDGTARTSTRLVHAPTDTNELTPEIAAAGEGYVITWRAQGDDPFNHGFGVSARYFNANGTPQDDTFWLNDIKNGWQEEAASDVLPDGSTAFVYGMYTYSSSWDLGIQVRDENGGEIIGETRIKVPGRQYQPDVAGLSDGRFVVMTISDSEEGGVDAYAQIASLDRSGAGVKLAFDTDYIRINNVTENSVNTLQVVGLAGGGFFAAWVESVPAATSPTGIDVGIFGRYFDATGTTVGEQLQIGQGHAPTFASLSVTESNTGGIFVTWKQGLGDTGRFSEFARVLEAPVTAPTFDDIFEGTGASDVFYGRKGDDTISGLGGKDSLFGGSGDDTISGGGGDDILTGDGGEDILSGGNGNDNLSGGNGNDSLSGGNGNDLITGGAGRDTLRGETGDDVLKGGSGNDLLDGGRGADAFIGGKGVDTATYTNAASGIRANLANATVNTGEAKGDTYTKIENLIGSKKADILSGDAGGNRIEGGNHRDRLDGRGGQDALFGDTGSDILKGGGGNDYLDGGKGQDKLSGGADQDTFFFNRNDGADTITDFEEGVDFIEIGNGANQMSDLTFTKSGSDVIVAFANVEITVEDITRAELNDSDNFIF